MKPKYSKRTVDEAVQLLDVYASNKGWFAELASALGARRESMSLAQAVWCVTWGRGWVGDALEAAQRLREGWRP